MVNGQTYRKVPCSAPWWLHGTGACLLLLLAAGGCEEPPDQRIDAGNADAGVDQAGATDSGVPGDDAGVVVGPDYSIVVLPDTQYYASSWPDIFMKQTTWIAENRDDQRIAFVLHTGDVVDGNDPAQWNVASNSLHVLDGIVPYVLTAGNHDYANLMDRTGMANFYFPPSAFAQYPWFGGTFEPGHIENSFSLLTGGTTRWVVIALEFGPRDETLAWADSVLKLFRDRPAIIITHAYLYHDSTRYDQRGPGQNFNPHTYVAMGQPGTTINDGQEIWQKLILPNRNVKLVFSGHDVNFDDLPPGTTGRLSSARPDGSVVHQVLANYQTCTAPPCGTSPQGSTVRGGNGYLRLVRFSPVAATISVSTYSPYVDAWLDDPANRFVLDMN